VTQVIKKISFLYKDERVIVPSANNGTFRVPVSEVVNGRVKTSYKNLTAREIIEHDVIKECDPVLTLKSGEKIRVFDGGDSSYLPAMSDGIITKHDSEQIDSAKSKDVKNIKNKNLHKSSSPKKRRTTAKMTIKNNKVIIPPLKYGGDPSDTIDDDFDYPWDDDYYD
tara:strand:- start:457 stop:957 length:501 start_codon:yes stop_codon:yes gene_type:complete